MNRIEALQAAFNIAGPNVTAEEHIQYAEFLLGDENTIVLENRTSKVDPREYNPERFVYAIGDRVFALNDYVYHVGAVARDFDGDVWVKTEDGWELYFATDGKLSKYWNGIATAANFESVFVA